MIEPIGTMLPASLSNSNLAALDSQLNQVGPSQTPPGKSNDYDFKAMLRMIIINACNSCLLKQLAISAVGKKH